MNFNTGVRVINNTTGIVGNVVTANDMIVILRTPDGEELTFAKSDCKTLKGRPRKMA